MYSKRVCILVVYGAIFGALVCDTSATTPKHEMYFFLSLSLFLFPPNSIFLSISSYRQEYQLHGHRYLVRVLVDCCTVLKKAVRSGVGRFQHSYSSAVHVR